VRVARRRCNRRSRLGLAVSNADSPLPARKSLRARGLLATVALLLYVALAGIYIAGERSRIHDSVQSLAELSRHEKALALTEAAVSGALLDVNEASNAALPAPAPPGDLRLYMESCAKLFAALDEFDPGYARLQRTIARSYDSLVAEPARANWIDLRESLARAAAELEIRRGQLAGQRESITASYQRSYDAVTVETMLLAIVGLVVFGSLAAWFFNRLARDVGRLEAHARQIVHGSRGAALEVHRDDELGRLMHAVNRMAVDLDEREQHIELEGQRRSHQDKMLAVGALAAGVAHEVNNPLAVIAGTAEALKQAALERHDSEAAAEAERILVQTRRAAQAARTLADAAAPQPSARDWFDLETLVRRVLQWMGYDRRYRGFVFQLHVEPGLPAVFSSAEVVQQALMQMLSLACDALVAQGEPRATVHVALAKSGATVEARLAFPARLDFLREDVQRTVMLGRAALAPLTAQLAFGQDDPTGSLIKLTLPMDTDAKSTQ
jgi:two-component system, NtrC family, sensor kinase